MSGCDLAFFVAWGLLIVGFVDREHILYAWLSAALVAGLRLFFC